MATPPEIDPARGAWVLRLHVVVDELAAPIERAQPGALACREGCAGCCVDELTVFEIEAELLRERYASLFAEGAPGPVGACAMLDAKGACRVYAHRPYVCRTQGLPLRWLEEDDAGEAFEARDVCPLNAEAVGPLEDASASRCWTIGPVEERLRERQRAVDGGEGRRVALRSLFAALLPR